MPERGAGIIRRAAPRVREIEEREERITTKDTKDTKEEP
jgi:hypothetical protein